MGRGFIYERGAPAESAFSGGFFGRVHDRMASKLLKPSRLIAAALVIGAALWIISGRLGPPAPTETATEAAATKAAEAVPIQKVGVTTATPEQHERTIVLSCVTEADRRASAVARGAGIITELSISRGAKVTSGETIAKISDEGRLANVAQAQASLDQVLQDYNSRKSLVDRGDAPRNTVAALESAVAGARAALAAAQAEADRSSVRAPIDGIVDTVAFQVGQAVQAGSEIAKVVDPDPMLAIGYVSESRRGLLEVGQTAEVRFIDGTKVHGIVKFVGLSADKATRTYPVEATMANANAEIGDGVTCEMTVALAPMQAAAVPRSALVFSDDGRLGVRIADEKSQARFMPVAIVDDGRESVWVSGLKGASRVIVVGQDFVKDGDAVEAVSAADAGPAKTTVPPA